MLMYLYTLESVVKCAVHVVCGCVYCIHVYCVRIHKGNTLSICRIEGDSKSYPLIFAYLEDPGLQGDFWGTSSYLCSDPDLMCA